MEQLYTFAIVIAIGYLLDYIIKKFIAWLSDNTPGSCHSNQNLDGRLQHYYSKYVDIPDMEMRTAKKVADTVKNHFKSYVTKYAPGVEFWETGSTAEGLKVISPDEFDVMVVLDPTGEVMNGCHCIVKEPRNIHDTSGFYVVGLDIPESGRKARKWLCPVRHCSVDGYLSPELVRRSFKSMMDHAFMDFSTYEVRRKERGPSVMLEVTYTSKGQTKHLSIDFVPAYKFGKRALVAKPHPKLSSVNHDKEYERLWRVSYSPEEKDEVLGIAGQSSYKVKCLKILKAIRVHRSREFGMLSSYTLKTVWLHFVNGKQKDMKEETLPECFVGLLKQLEEFLRNRRLPHFFHPSIDLLSHMYVSEAWLPSAWGYLYKEIRKGTFENILTVPSKYHCRS